MSSDLSHDGAAAVLRSVGPNSPIERRRARRWCASQALARAGSEARTALRDLLDMTGLNPTEGEAR